MPEQTIVFSELEKEVATHIQRLKTKGEAPVIISDKTTEPTHGVCSRTVLVTNGYELTSFCELWIESYGPLGMVTKGTVSASDARKFVEYLDKKRFPQLAEGESGR